jgi:hypothetical protein
MQQIEKGEYKKRISFCRVQIRITGQEHKCKAPLCLGLYLFYSVITGAP